MSNEPIYVEAIREAKRRTKRRSPERRTLELMDAQTDPERAPGLRALAGEAGEL